MSVPVITYAQLLETNNLIQQNANECFYLCFYRTVQESKLFPVPSYMMMSYLNAFYRYPSLLKKIEDNMSAEHLGDYARNSGLKVAPSVTWGLANFYLLGREYLINIGLLRPEDALEDVVYVLDFWKRFMLSWQRNNGHLIAIQAGHRAQIHSERQLQIFHADMFDCEEGDELHTAAQNCLATVSQYTFLVSCESRMGQNNMGPYNLGNGREMLVREFVDLSESSYPWLDGVGASVPYNNLVVPMAAEGVHFNRIDDWGSFSAEPEFQGNHLKGVGLYTYDMLSDGYIPIGMDSRESLVKAFDEINEGAKEAMANLWKRLAGYSRDQLMDAGAITYYAIAKDLAHIAGCYDPDDWMKIDTRAERFRPLFNDEYGRDILGELVGLISNPSQRMNEYAMMQHSNAPTRVYSLLPYHVLDGGDYNPSVGGLAPGISYLPEKEDRYNTTQGIMGIDDLNARAREAKVTQAEWPYRFLCEQWVKHHADSELAEEMYKKEQSSSRLLKDKGSGLSRDEVEALRRQS